MIRFDLPMQVFAKITFKIKDKYIFFTEICHSIFCRNVFYIFWVVVNSMQCISS